MGRKNDEKLSKFISLVLRHKPEEIALELDSEGWASVDDLVERSGGKLAHDDLLRIVAQSDKQRFVFSPDQTRIRANQGHSIAVDLGLKPQTPPDTLYHGTATRFVDAILIEGLDKRSRQHVHLSPDIQTARAVGQRHGAPVILQINSRDMHVAGHTFLLSDNGVWLTQTVPPAFLSKTHKE